MKDKSRFEIRKQLLSKFAQETTAVTSTTPATISGSPRGVGFLDGLTNIQTVFGIGAKTNIVALANYLDIVLYFSTPKQYSFQQLYNNPDSIGISTIPDSDLKKLVEFCKVFLSTIIKIQPAKLSKDAIMGYLSALDNNPSLNSLSNENLSGQLATKVPGNVKTNIKTYIQKIKQSI